VSSADVQAFAGKFIAGHEPLIAISKAAGAETPGASSAAAPQMKR
jgi:hypothetical protein